MIASESGIELAWKVEQEMDASGTDCMLQLCNRHTAEAVKARSFEAIRNRKRLIRVRYSHRYR